MIQALDRLEGLPGFRPGSIEWGSFGFSGSAWGAPLDTAWIAVYGMQRRGNPADEGVRFRMHEDHFGLYGPGLRPLRLSEAAQALGAPPSSTGRAALLLRDALRTALTEYNDAHTPRRDGPNRRLAPVEVPDLPQAHRARGLGT